MDDITQEIFKSYLIDDISNNYTSIPIDTYLKNITTELSRMIHTSGIYNQHSPVFPDQITTQIKDILPVIRLFGNYLFSSNVIKPKANDLINNLFNDINKNNTIKIVKTDGPQINSKNTFIISYTNSDSTQTFYHTLKQDDFRRALCISVFSRELFLNIENENFGIDIDDISEQMPTLNIADITNQYTDYLDHIMEFYGYKNDSLFYKLMYSNWYQWYKCNKYKRHNVDDFKTIMASTTGQDLYKANPLFKQWSDDVLYRFVKIINNDYNLNKKDIMNNYFVKTYIKAEERIWFQFLECCKHVWATHKLMRGFTRMPPFIRFQVRDQYDKKRMISYSFPLKNQEIIEIDFNNSTTICAFTIFPGFIIDGSIVQCDVFILYHEDDNKKIVIYNE